MYDIKFGDWRLIRLFIYVDVVSVDWSIAFRHKRIVHGCTLHTSEIYL